MTGATIALPLLFFFAAPFWEAKAPAQWTDLELGEMLGDSPWTQPAAGPASAPVRVFLATARPIEQAIGEIQRRAKLKNPPKVTNEPVEPDIAVEDYLDWLRENRDKHFVLAVDIANPRAFGDAAEVKRMEDSVILRIGRKKIKMTGHFPPSPADPYLRLAFPREAQLSDKTMTFELYIPGVSIPFRTVEFNLKNMVVRGKLEM